MVQDAAKYALQPALAESNLVVGEHFSAWCEERAYSPIIELACMPDAVSTMLAKAGVALWEAAQAEAAAVLEGERRRMAEAVATERELRNEALGMVDAREAVIEGLRAEIARHAAELDASRRKVATVRAGVLAAGGSGGLGDPAGAGLAARQRDHDADRCRPGAGGREAQAGLGRRDGQGGHRRAEV